MNNQSNIEKLISSNKHVVTVDDLALIWGINDRKKLVALIRYYLRAGKIKRLHKGVYAWGQYTQLDLAQKLVPFSYISLYTTAQIHGLTFQVYQTIFSLSLSSKKLEVEGQKYEYHKIKQQAFYHPLGLLDTGQYFMASKERTICDMLYVYPKSAFDNLRGIDTKLLQQIAAIYGNKRLIKEVKNIIKQIEREY